MGQYCNKRDMKHRLTVENLFECTEKEMVA